MMNIVQKIHITDVRDVGDISKKKEVLKKIFTLGRKLGGTQRS
jgi:hypothetical protein